MANTYQIDKLRTDLQARRRPLLHGMIMLVAAAITVNAATETAQDREAERGRSYRGVYAIGLWGDLPYSSVQAESGVPNLIADMNSQDLAFTAHNGDLKSGSSVCTDTVYVQALLYFNSLRAPAAFTPGDND
jgi:hypothetical protein